MNKRDLVREVARRVYMTISDVDLVIDTMNEIMVEELNKGNDFCMNGYYTMKVYHVGERGGYDAIRGKPIVKPARMMVRAQTGQRLKNIGKVDADDKSE